LARGPFRSTKPRQTANTDECELGRQTPGANVRRQEGNNPDHQLRSPNTVKWKKNGNGNGNGNANGTSVVTVPIYS